MPRINLNKVVEQKKEVKVKSSRGVYKKPLVKAEKPKKIVKKIALY